MHAKVSRAFHVQLDSSDFEVAGFFASLKMAREKS